MTMREEILTQRQQQQDMRVARIKKLVALGAIGLVGLVTLFLAVYTVPEGHVGIVTRFSKATYQVDPGLRYKVPYVDSVELMEVRQRRNTETMSAASGNQLPLTAQVSINWTIQKESAFDIYVKYGGVQQFEERILDPKFRQATKAALSKYSVADLIRERDRAAATVQEQMVALMEAFPVDVNSPQIENIEPPQQYMEAVLAKEQARENAVKEEHVLNQQKLQAQQAVQTAAAERDAQMARADGQAYKTRIEAEAAADAKLALATAEAKGLALVAKSLEQNPQLIQYEQVKKWAGQVPATVLSGSGSGANILYSLPGGGGSPR